MCRQGLVFSIAAFLAAASGCSEPSDSRDPAANIEKSADDKPAVRVLFVGNSYTSNHNLPQIVGALSKAAGRRIEVSTGLVDGATLQEHLAGDAGRKVRDEPLDVVVLQEQSLMPVGAPRQMHESARRLHAAIMAKNPQARVVFFETWARRDRPEDQAKIRRAYQEIAKELKAQVAPAGDAWQAALAADPKRELYAADGSHPTESGSYLAACVIAATILKRSPEGFDAQNIPADEAKKLQEIAAGAIQKAAEIPAKKPSR